MDGFDMFEDQNVIIVCVSMCDNWVKSLDNSIIKCIGKIFFRNRKSRYNQYYRTSIIELDVFCDNRIQDFV